MPPFYDIYGFSKQRDRETIDRFLDFFSFRTKNENVEGQEIFIYRNEKYKIDEICIPINTLTEVINFGLENPHLGYVFYIGENLKEGINHIILKFTFDGNMIFGISVQEEIFNQNGKLVDNYPKAVEIEKSIIKLTNSIKSSVQFEYAPSNDEDEFDEDIEMWRNMNEEKSKMK